MDNELKEVMDNILNRIDKLDKRMGGIEYKVDRMDVIEYKLDRTNECFENLDLKVDNLELRLRNAESNIRKDIKKLSDENDTIIEVLKQNELLPR